MVKPSLTMSWHAGGSKLINDARVGYSMDPSNRVSTKFAPTGTAEIEHNGKIYRGTYRTAAAIVIVSYGGQERQMQMRRRSDTPLGIAQMLLREIVVKVHESI